MKNAIESKTLTKLAYFESGVADPISLGRYLVVAIKFMKQLGNPNDTDISDKYISKLHSIFTEAHKLYTAIASGINKNQIPDNDNTRNMLKTCESISRHYGSNCTVQIDDHTSGLLLGAKDLAKVPENHKLEVSAVRDHKNQIPEKSAIMDIINQLVNKLVAIHNEEA